MIENFDFQKLQGAFEKVQRLQGEMETKLEHLAIHGSSGGGAVKVVINGRKELTKIEIDPEAAKDAEMLGDLIIAALNAAYTDANQQLKGDLPSFLNSFDLSGLQNLFKS